MKLQKSLAILMLSLGVLLVGCGNKSEGSSSAVGKKNSDGIYEPTVTITAAKQLDENTGKYAKGDDINNNPMTRLTKKKLGINIKTTLLGGDAGNYDTKLRLALTGSEDLPDVFPVYGTQMISDMIESGKVKAIDKDIDKYMSKRMQKIYKKYPSTFNPITKDGKTYGIAISPSLTEGETMIIRQDWLDKLGLKAPTNMAEFEKVIQAFTEEDPDGNGKNDTYGFTYSGSDIYNTGWVSDPVMLFSANTGKYLPGSWQKDSNGNLTYGSINKENRDTLKTMSDWHKKGYLFKEAAATGAWDAMNEFTEGKAGIFVGRSWAIGSVNDLVKNNKNAVVKAYPTIRQNNGKPTYQTAELNDGWLMFNKNFNNIKAFFDYYDWLYDEAFGTGDFKYGYIQKEDYDLVDGNPVYDSNKFNKPKAKTFLSEKSLIIKNAPHIDTMLPSYNVVVKNQKPTNHDEYIAAGFLKTLPAQAKGTALAYEHKDEQIANQFNGEPTKTMKNKWEQLQTLEKQTYTNIIYGKEPISAFDKFVNKWKSDGGTAITKEVNEWYSTVNSK